MDFGVFEVATYSPSEGQLRKEAAQDKLAAAIYDVREKYGSYLFQADSPRGFDDRGKLMYADICRTIEPHLHARTGVYSRVMKALKKEWKTAVQTENTMAQVTDQSVANSQVGKGGIKPPAPPKVHTHQPQLIGKVACYPGCHEDEAHAKKFHKKDGDDKKEAAAPVAPRSHGYPSWMDENDMDAWSYPAVPSEARHDFFKDLMEEAPEGYDVPPQRPSFDSPPGGESFHTHGLPRDLSRHHQEEMGYLANRRQAGPPVSQDPQRAHEVLEQTRPKVDELHQKHHQILDHAHELVDQHGGYDPINDLLQSPLGQNYMAEQELGYQPQVHAPEQFYASRRHGEFEDQSDHPELDTHETYKPSLYEPLKPEGDFDAYKDSVDQGAESKVDHDFTSPNGGTVREHNDDGDHNFVPRVTGSRTFQALSRLITADPNMQTPTPAPPGNANMDPGAGSGAVGGAIPETPVMSTTSPAGSGAPVTASYYHQISAMLRQAAPGPIGAPAPAAPPAAPGAPGGAGDSFFHPVNPFGGGHEESEDSPVYHPGPNPPDISGQSHWSDMPGFGAAKSRSRFPLRQAIDYEPVQPDSGLGAPEPGAGSRGKSFSNVPGAGADFGVPGADGAINYRGGKKWALKQIQEVGTKEARHRLLAVARSHGVLDVKTHARISNLLTRKVADSNYLQKADEALTKVLNEKAEEFQQTIAPLQQALITIQQAEQMANPLNVSPPAGSIQALPGQPQAGAAAMGASGGGVGMGVQPAAAGLAGQPATQAMQQTARKRGGQGKGRRAR